MQPCIASSHHRPHHHYTHPSLGCNACVNASRQDQHVSSNLVCQLLTILRNASDIPCVSLCLQAAFGACARIVVRDLRRTETTDIIMVYSGTMHCICAAVACVTVPGSVVILQHTWQVMTLLLTGDGSQLIWALC